jgi:hypothetical protein
MKNLTSHGFPRQRFPTSPTRGFLNFAIRPPVQAAVFSTPASFTAATPDRPRPRRIPWRRTTRNFIDTAEWMPSLALPPRRKNLELLADPQAPRSSNGVRAPRTHGRNCDQSNAAYYDGARPPLRRHSGNSVTQIYSSIDGPDPFRTPAALSSRAGIDAYS